MTQIQFTQPLDQILVATRNGTVAPVLMEYPNGETIVGVESTKANGGTREPWGERDIARFISELASRGVTV